MWCLCHWTKHSGMLSILEEQKFAKSINKVINCTKIIKWSLILADNSSSKIQKCLCNFGMTKQDDFYVCLFSSPWKINPQSALCKPFLEGLFVVVYSMENTLKNRKGPVRLNPNNITDLIKMTVLQLERKEHETQASEAEKVVSYCHLTQVSIPAATKIPKKTHVLIVSCLYYKVIERLFFLVT